MKPPNKTEEKNMQKNVLITLLATGISSLVMAQPNPVAPLNLRDAVELAKQRNPSLQTTIEAVQQAEFNIPVARAAVLPNISAIGLYDYKKDASNVGGNNTQVQFGGDPYNYYNADIHLTQPLFQIGSLAAINIVKKTRDISKLGVKEAVRDLTSNVIQAYYQVLLNVRNVDTLFRQQKIVRESLVTTQRRLHTGRNQLLDVLQTQTQVALLDAQITTAKNQVSVAAATLANVLGDPEAKEIRIKGDLNVPPLATVDENTNLKVFEIPELEANLLQISQADDTKRVALGQNLPSLGLVGDYMYTNYKASDVFNSYSNSWAVGVQLTVPLFSGFSSIYQQHALESAKIQLQDTRVNLENQFTLQQVTSRKNLESAYQSILDGEEALKLAIASSDEATRQYKLGTIDFLQFLTVQQAYVQAEQSLNAYKYTYLTSLTSYYVAFGQGLDPLVGMLERSLNQ